MEKYHISTLFNRSCMGGDEMKMTGFPRGGGGGGEHSEIQSGLQIWLAAKIDSSACLPRKRERETNDKRSSCRVEKNPYNVQYNDIEKYYETFWAKLVWLMRLAEHWQWKVSERQKNNSRLDFGQTWKRRGLDARKLHEYGAKNQSILPTCQIKPFIAIALFRTTCDPHKVFLSVCDTIMCVIFLLHENKKGDFFAQKREKEGEVGKCAVKFA